MTRPLLLWSQLHPRIRLRPLRPRPLWPLRNLRSLSTASPHHQPSFDQRKIYIPWHDGATSAYHNIWLRDGCQCPVCMHPLTKQRLLDTFAIPPGIKPESADATDAGLEVKWSDGHESVYPWDWLHTHSYQPVLDKGPLFPQTLWTRTDVIDSPPAVQYADILSTGVAEWTSLIKQHGFCFIDGVPPTPEATESLVSLIAPPRSTHYGGFWDFTSDLAKADTAYTDLALRVHTDGTYFTDPPGLQLLHCLHHSGAGGESLLVDGFKAARVLRDEAPEHYKTLSRIRIPAHAAGNEDVCIMPSLARPVLNHADDTGELMQVRWNNDDRSTMDRWGGADPDVDVVSFYDAIRAWNEILSRPEMVYTFKLRPGRPVIFDNWRVLHGRTAFDGQRRLCGAYVNMDDFDSRLRLAVLGREKVLMYL
ncbi:uncharacterized protein V1518DRAFT_423636 [Limtongia smithiae]|uniref:uncharacterized protein n=1 Tax=Limtongia smithiae TaxID=1125753 RepID=UPI0034CFE88C